MFKGIIRILGFGRNKTPQVKVLGVYEVKGKSYCLIEVLVKGCTGPFDLREFTQKWPTVPRLKWPKPYMAKLLNSDGTKIVADIDPGTSTDPLLWTGNMRICFFFHFPAYDLPLLTPWGNVLLPVQRPRPKRLIMVRYKQPETT